MIHCLSIVSAGDRRDVIHCLLEIGEMWFTVCGRQERCGSLFVSLCVQEIREMRFTVCGRQKRCGSVCLVACAGDRRDVVHCLSGCVCRR